MPHYKIMKTETLIKKLLDTAPCNWQAIVNKHALKMDAEQKRTLGGTMEDMAGRLAYLARYTEHRSDGANHKAAAATARKQCARVNKAMGYTYADRRAFNL